MLCSFTRWTVIPKKKIFATITETVMNFSCHVGLDDASPCSPVISWWLGLREQLWHYKSLLCISIWLSCHCFTISLVIINRTGMTPLRYFTIPEPFSTLTHYSKGQQPPCAIPSDHRAIAQVVKCEATRLQTVAVTLKQIGEDLQISAV